ncbi:MAG TPA: DUF2877 domain-containing protein [Conexibacter sp.]|nr:DUF2877 domain-containing protein [Conexibacter sp.]
MRRLAAPARRTAGPWPRRSQVAWAGRVRCCTSEVAYVDAGRRLIALHDDEVEAFPFSVVIAEGRRAEGLVPGAPVRRAGATVWIGGRPHAAAVAAGGAIRPAADQAALRAALAGRPAVRRRRGELAGVLDAALHALRAGAHAEAVRLLVGWGPGLTPSGDDVLVGLAAGAALRAEGWGANALLERAARAAPARTTFVSAALLRAAAAGVFAPALRALGEAAGGAGATAAIERVARIGSRSGLDLLVGVELGLGWSQTR